MLAGPVEHTAHYRVAPMVTVARILAQRRAPRTQTAWGLAFVDGAQCYWYTCTWIVQAASLFTSRYTSPAPVCSVVVAPTFPLAQIVFTAP